MTQRAIHSGQETLTLYSPGSLPGIPGETHGPGVFLVDWDARTIEFLAALPAVPETEAGSTAPAPPDEATTPDAGTDMGSSTDTATESGVGATTTETSTEEGGTPQ